MQVIDIDLKRSPEIADAAVDIQPGDAVDLHATVKAKTDQTLTLTVEEVSIPDPEEKTEDTPTPTDEGGVGNEGSGDVLTPPGESVDGMGRETAAN